MSSFQLFEFKFLTSLEGLRTPFCDAFFRFLNIFDSPFFAAFLVTIVWLGFSQKWGARLFFICALSTLVNIDLKDLFAEGRPLTYFPNIALVKALGYSFPSGGAQGAVVNFGMLAYMLRRGWAWPCAILTMLLIGFSRLYLGVHFLHDVVGGFLIGAILLIGYIFFLPKVEPWLAKKNKSTLFNLSFFIPLIVMCIHITIHSIGIVFISIGVGVGWIAAHRLYAFRLPSLSRRRAGLVLLALMGICILYTLKISLQTILPHSGMQTMFEMLFNFLIGYWLSFGALFFYHKTRFHH